MKCERCGFDSIPDFEYPGWLICENCELRVQTKAREGGEGKMKRNDLDLDENGNGFDYATQAWVKDYKYIRCGHPDEMDCSCFGKRHEGDDVY